MVGNEITCIFKHGRDQNGTQRKFTFLNIYNRKQKSLKIYQINFQFKKLEKQNKLKIERA